MIVLDTNVVSELLRPNPMPQVVTWVDAQAADDLWLCSVVLAELLYGVERLPQGRKREALSQALRDVVELDFDARVLPFDADCAATYATLIGARERAGRPIHQADAQIAAICRTFGARLATRKVKDFEGLDLALINPWALG